LSASRKISGNRGTNRAKGDGSLSASFVDTLFIDEGFGSLDAETLDIAVDALETLQGRGQKVGVITHVAAMIDRITVQVRVEKRGAGRSEIRIVDGVGSMWSATDIGVAQ
jgi:DNA repair protein SbcC/Rad50